MFLSFLLASLIYFECIIVAGVLGLEISADQSDYIPLHKLNRNTTFTGCNFTQSQKNQDVYLIDGVSGEVCKITDYVENWKEPSNTCNQSSYLLQSICFGEVALTLFINCYNGSQQIQESVQFHVNVFNCSEVRFNTSNCETTNVSIVNLTVDSLEIRSELYNLDDLKDCKEVVFNVSSDCSVSTDNTDVIFDPNCLRNVDTRCFYNKYVFSTFTCTQNEVIEHIGTTNKNDNYTKYSLNMTCGIGKSIEITNMEIRYSTINSTNCMENKIVCDLDQNDQTAVMNTCNNQSSCTKQFMFSTECANKKEMAFFNAFYYSGNKEVKIGSECMKYDTKINICEPSKNAPLWITLYPQSVSLCLNEQSFVIADNIKKIRDAECHGKAEKEVNLMDLCASHSSCLTMEQRIRIYFICKNDGYSNTTDNITIFTELTTDSQEEESVSTTTELVDSTTEHASTYYNYDHSSDQTLFSTENPLSFTSTRKTSEATDDLNDDSSLSSSDKQENNGSSAVVIGGVVGGVLFLGLIVVGIVFIYRRRFDLGKPRQKSHDKSLIRQNSLQDYRVVQNVAYAAHNGNRSRALIKPVENSTYQEIINDSNCSNGVNQNSSKPSSSKRQPQVAKNTITSSSKNKDDVSNNHTYLDLPNGPFNSVSYTEVKKPKKDTRNWARKNDSYDNAHDLPLFGYSKSGDTNPYSLRKDGVYDTTNIHTQTKDDSYSGNHYDLRMSGTYDTSQAQSKPRPRESDDDVNHYDLRISGTYDTSQALSKPRVREVNDDVNPYDIRVSGTYDSASNVAGRLKNCDDNSDNTYDHFFGKKTDGNYDEVTTRSAKPTSSIYGQ